ILPLILQLSVSSVASSINLNFGFGRSRRGRYYIGKLFQKHQLFIGIDKSQPSSSIGKEFTIATMRVLLVVPDMRINLYRFAGKGTRYLSILQAKNYWTIERYTRNFPGGKVYSS